jgi:hypothetical protein
VAGVGEAVIAALMRCFPLLLLRLLSGQVLAKWPFLPQYMHRLLAFRWLLSFLESGPRRPAEISMGPEWVPTAVELPPEWESDLVVIRAIRPPEFWRSCYLSLHELSRRMQSDTYSSNVSGRSLPTRRSLISGLRPRRKVAICEFSSQSRDAM